MAVLMSCLRDVTPRLSQKRRRGSPERTDEGYGDHLTRSLGSLTTQMFMFSSDLEKSGLVWLNG